MLCRDKHTDLESRAQTASVILTTSCVNWLTNGCVQISYTIQRKGLQLHDYLFLRFLGLHQGVPVCNGLSRIGQHLVPVIAAKTLSTAAQPHHTDDLIMTYPVETHTHTHTQSMNTPGLTRYDISHSKLLLLFAGKGYFVTPEQRDWVPWPCVIGTILLNPCRIQTT